MSATLVRYLTEKQVATITGLSVFTLRNLRHQRQRFPYTKLGTGKGAAVRYLEQDILDAMQANRVEVDTMKKGDGAHDG